MSGILMKITNQPLSTCNFKITIKMIIESLKNLYKLDGSLEHEKKKKQ